MKFIFPVFLTFLLFSCSGIKENDPADQRATSRTSMQDEPKLLPETIEFAGKLFQIGPDINRQTCEIVVECDCCTSDLLFLSEKNFVYNSYCQSDETVVKGSYQVKDGKLFLTCEPLMVEYAYNWEREVDTTAVEYFLKAEKRQIADMTYEIGKCKEGTVITLKDIGPNTSPEIGMENKASSNKEQIQIMKEKGIWAKLEME